MTQNDKELLLKDLCARLPYGVIVEVTYKDGEGWKTEDRKLLGIYEDSQVYVDAVYTNILNVRPYLRSMSSMTTEECIELGELPVSFDNISKLLPNTPYYIEVIKPEQIDWLNAHHFDYRGLIKKGLALEAHKGMYN